MTEDAMSDAVEETVEDVAEVQEQAIEAPTTEESDAVSDVADDVDAEAERKARKYERLQQKIAKQAYRERELEREVRAMRKAMESAKPEAKAPKMDDFDSIDEYVRAQIKFEKQQESAETPETDGGIGPIFAEKLEELHEDGLEKYSDFLEVVASAQVTPVMAEALLELDGQVDVAYYLGKNPKEVARISKLPPIRQVAEIGKLEIKITQEPTKPRQQSKAPMPLKPVSGKETPSSDHSPNDSMESYLKKRNARLGRG